MSRKKFIKSFLDSEGFRTRLREVFSGETQAQVAAKLAIRQGYISRYVRGHVPDPEILVRIGEVYHVSLDWLLRGQGRKGLPQDSYARELGARIRAVREALDLHPALFAQALGLDTVGELEAAENGEPEAPRPWLERIAAGWNVDLHWLQTGEWGMFHRFGEYNSFGCRDELVRLLQNRKLDRVEVLRSEHGGTPMVGFVGEKHAASPVRGSVYYILAGQCSPAGGTGIAALKDILYEVRYGFRCLMGGYDLPPEDFDKLFAGTVNPVKVIPKGRAQAFDPVDTYLSDAEIQDMRTDRERARRVQAQVEAQRRTALRETIVEWFRSLPRRERDTVMRQLRGQEADAPAKGREAHREPTR